jgi:hypothetical protein
MALVVKDRVKETTTTTGTGTLTLAGAAGGFQAFSAIGDGNTTYYAIVDSATGDWEVGLGTYTASGTTLSRDTILESSNTGAAVNLAAGTKSVFATYPAEKSVFSDDLPVSGTDFDPVGTDNSTDVTLAGSYDYITISGQTITRNQVDYTTDIANTPTIPTNNNELTNGAGYITGNQTITLSGDASGSGTTSIAVTVADDSHNHVISNVDGLQTALDGKQATGDYVVATGDSMTGNLSFGDNDKAIFGAGSDLQIYHDGSNSYLTDQGQGDMYITTLGNAIYFSKHGTENLMALNVDGDVKLYYNNAEKLATTSTGIDVTGTVTADNVGIGTSSPLRDLHVSNNGAEGYEFGPGESANKNQTLHYNRSTSQYIENSNRASQHTWDVSASEAMRIDSSGNVGIGTSTITSPASWKTIRYGDVSAITDIETGNVISSNWYYNSGHKRIASGYAQRMVFGTNGEIDFDLAGTSTADSAISWSTGMRIDSSGNVGIGASSPSSALDVNGTVTATSFSGSGANLTGITGTLSRGLTYSTSAPAITTNPSTTGHIWVNYSLGDVYVCTDNTTGANVWTNVGNGTTDVVPASAITATGGTVTTSGDYKIHTFTSSGTFTVSDAGAENGGIDYIVVSGGAGGGGGSDGQGGGGGAGGLASVTGASVTAQAYTVTVGAGGGTNNGPGSNGGTSSFNSTSVVGGGGGGGSNTTSDRTGKNGACGGGAGYVTSTYGTGSVGYDGAANSGGGGGMGAAGASYGNGGSGVTSSISGSSTYYCAGGGAYTGTTRTNGIGGAQTGGTTGTANSGSGGAGCFAGSFGSGGSGIVIIRYKYQNL